MCYDRCVKRNRPHQSARKAREGVRRHLRAVKRRAAAKHVAASTKLWLTLRSPAKFSLHENNEETVLYLRRIYDQVVIFNQRCVIDLSGLKSISVGAALALVAEINRAEILRPGHTRGILPLTAKLRALLNSVGFVTASAGFTATYEEPGGGQFLRMRSGLAEEAKNTAFLDAFLRSIFPPDTMPDAVRGRLKGAVTEALLNVVDHAYNPDIDRDHKCPDKRWWIFGAAHPTEGCYFVVYDLGVGIPATVPSTAAESIREAYQALGNDQRRADYELIKIAVTRPSSRTGIQGRGRGLPEMRRLIDRVGDGMLWITSGRGHYIYARGEKPLDYGFSMNHDLHGTLVVWQLKVSDAIDELGGGDG